MDFLPPELSLMIIDHLPLHDLVACCQTSWSMYNLYMPIVRSRLAKMPWKITVDFSRDRDHHIHIHYCWIKLGWFPRDLDQYNMSNFQRLRRQLCLSNGFQQASLHLHECCDICPYTIDPTYVVVRFGYGGPVLDSLLRYGRHPRLQMDKGFLPIIHGLTDATTHSGYIYIEESKISFLVGRDRPMLPNMSQIPMGYTRSLVTSYNNDDHILCRSNLVG